MVNYRKDHNPESPWEEDLVPYQIGDRDQVVEFWLSQIKPAFDVLSDEKYGAVFHELLFNLYDYLGELSFGGKQVVDEAIQRINAVCHEYVPHKNDKFNAPIFKTAWMVYQLLSMVSVADRLKVYHHPESKKDFWQFADGIPLSEYVEKHGCSKIWVEVKHVNRIIT